MRCRRDGIQHVDLAVGDVERSLAFYYLEYGVQAFGLRPADEGAYSYYGIGIEHVAFEDDHPDEVDEAYARCVAVGGKIQSTPERHYVEDEPDYYAFFAFDPHGIRIEEDRSLLLAGLALPHRLTRTSG